MKLKDMTKSDIESEINKRRESMTSNEMIDLLDILYINQGDSFSSAELEEMFSASYREIKERIQSLRSYHDLDIANISKKGVPAQYQLVGFKAKKAPKKVKLSIPTPSTFNPLIAQVFA